MPRPRISAALRAPAGTHGRPPADAAPPAVCLDGLGIAGLRSRHVAVVTIAVIVVWVLVTFAGQVSEAASAAERTEQMRAANAVLAGQVQALERELDVVTGSAWVEQQARAYQLGTTDERAFRLAPGAPSLAPDAPGSPTVRLGADAERQVGPLEAWLEVIFGPAPGG